MKLKNKKPRIEMTIPKILFDGSDRSDSEVCGGVSVYCRPHFWQNWALRLFWALQAGQNLNDSCIRGSFQSMGPRIPLKILINIMPIKNNMITAGIAAIAHLTMKITIELKLILKSTTTTSCLYWGFSL